MQSGRNPSSQAIPMDIKTGLSPSVHTTKTAGNPELNPMGFKPLRLGRGTQKQHHA